MTHNKPPIACQSPTAQLCEIRNATLLDVNELARINVESWKFAYKNILPESYLDSLSLQELKPRWERGLQVAHRNCLVVIVGGRMVGYTIFGPPRSKDSENGSAELFAIYFSPEFVAQGFGTRLMNKVKFRLAELKYQTCLVWILERNERAIEFYLRQGFCFSGNREPEIFNDCTLQKRCYVLNIQNFSAEQYSMTSTCS